MSYSEQSEEAVAGQALSGDSRLLNPRGVVRTLLIEHFSQLIH